MKAQEIYDILRSGGLSRAGALGMLGNMQAESGLKENIAQRGMTTLSDEEYTRRADAGLIDFVHDSVGYGLTQLTYFSRKQAYLNKARSSGKSVGDGPQQVEFALEELCNDYPALLLKLCSSDDIDDCTDSICRDFERPAVNNFLTRRAFAHNFESECVDHEPGPAPEPDPSFPPDPSIMLLQAVMQYNGYWGDIDGRKSAEFFKCLRQFVDDMEVC